MATTRPLPVLRGERVLLRPIREEDAAVLVALLAEPAVAAWWQGWNAERVQRDLVAEQEWEVVLAIEVEGALVGFLLVGEEEEPEYRHASLDIALARLGFKPVGVMRRCERGADGTWHDGLLMDLLAEEFRAL